MFKVLMCVYGRHEWWLVLLAAVVCVTAAVTTFRVWGLAMASTRSSRWIWVGVAGFVAGAGIWSTHFVAVLAYEPHLRTGYETGMTVGSLLIAVVTCIGGLALAASARKTRLRALAGVIVGVGIGMMHFAGMSAFRTQGRLLWDEGYVVASLLIGASGGALALVLAGRAATLKSQLIGAGVLTLAICGMHFTAMTAVTIAPDARAVVPTSLMSHTAMAIAVAVIAVAIVLAAVAAQAMNAANRRSALSTLRSAIDAMPDALAFFDSEDRLVAWNTRFAEEREPVADLIVAGRGYEALLRAEVGSGLYPAAEADPQGWIAARLDMHRRAEGSAEHRTRDGRWIRTDDRRTDGQGTVSVFVDITRLKAAEAEQARAKEAAEAANRAKSEFLANMSHEIRTPMNGVIGMNALLMRTPLTADQKKYAEAVRLSADSLLSIINDILDISKLEAGKVELEQVAFSLEKVVEDVIELMSPRAAEKALELACYLDDGARQALKGDPTRMRQVLLNLVSNGVKFTDSGYVGVEVISRALDGERVALRVSVHDSGIGLTPEARGRLFQKFEQADGSVTRKFGGTGLGLSICRQLVELMGGEIGVDDRAGGGSTFWFEAAFDVAEAVSPERPLADLAGARILVVDDIELNRTIFRRQLEDAGAVVVEAAGGLECLQRLADAASAGEPIALVLLDHMMPGMAGDAVAAAIRADRSLEQPRIVIASSMGPPLETVAAIPCDAFLTKPVRLRQLIDCVGGLIAPRAAAAVDVAAEAVRATPAGPGGRVLLAEDNDINAMLARAFLEQAGYHVTWAQDGAQAVEAAQAEAFDLILMDVQMPVMDGLEATRRIRAGAARAPPIIAMTANAMREDRDACLAAGMTDFISKPIDPDAFLATIATALGGGRVADEAQAGSAAELADVDLAQLERVRRMMPDRFAVMLDAYLASADQRAAELVTLAGADDLAPAAKAAHSLKGSSSNFGAMRVAALAARLEQTCKRGDGPQAARLAGELADAVRTAAAAFRSRDASGDVQLKAG